MESYGVRRRKIFRNFCLLFRDFSVLHSFMKFFNVAKGWVDDLFRNGDDLEAGKSVYKALHCVTFRIFILRRNLNCAKSTTSIFTLTLITAKPHCSESSSHARLSFEMSAARLLHAIHSCCASLKLEHFSLNLWVCWKFHASTADYLQTKMSYFLVLVASSSWIIHCAPRSGTKGLTAIKAGARLDTQPTERGHSTYMPMKSELFRVLLVVCGVPCKARIIFCILVCALSKSK